MGKYLDPKSDVVFKKIFGQHTHLLKSFLNSILPLSEGRLIESLEYLPSEQIPIIPIIKTPIVDVKCKDQRGQIFIVEMQIDWSTAFMQRLLYGTASAFVKQLHRGEHYRLLNPVYGLGIVNDIFDKDSLDWYHHFGMVKVGNQTIDEKPIDNKVIEGLTLVFVELPKFSPKTMRDKKLQTLWLRFMREITDETREIDPALLEVPEIREAVELAKEAAYTPAELEAYENYWKAISTERTLLLEREEKGKAEGKVEEKTEIAKTMKMDGVSIELIIKYTGLSREEIERL